MSNYSKILNYTAKDSLVEGDPNKIIKGTELDAEFVAIQTAVATKADIQSPTFTGVPRAPTAATGTNTTQIATTAFVQANGVPVGGIIMWSGLIANIPTNWTLCNGSNGTPDLRDKFIVGAGSTYSPAATGGASTVTLVEANLPAHTHAFTGSTASGGSHNHVVTDPGHTHGTERFGSPSKGADGGANWSYSTGQTATQTTGISLAAHAGHTHDVTGTCATTGSGTAVNILPPYFALAFIMRTA